MFRSIVLVGFRGCGKTTIAKALAAKLGLDIYSTDERFVESHGPIGSFIEKNDWTKFRQLESEILRSIPDQPMIVDCGGGILDRADNLPIIVGKGDIIHLTASMDQIRHRISATDKRPALTTGGNALDEIEEVLANRLPLYLVAASLTIDTSVLDIPAIVENIIAHYQRPLICLSLCSTSQNELFREIHTSQRRADFIEIRLDFLNQIGSDFFTSMNALCTRPHIYTLRPIGCGGKFSGTEQDRERIVEKILDSTNALIDLEYGTRLAIKVLKEHPGRIVYSSHDFAGTPSLIQLKHRFARMNKRHPALVKIVTTPKNCEESLRLYYLLENKDNLISFGMGKWASSTRILAHRCGSQLTYTSVNSAKTTAPGQWSIDDLETLFRYRSITTKTKIYGLIGSSPETSLSPYLHNAQFQLNRVDCVYLPFAVAKGDLGDFIAMFRYCGFSGASVTVPHKVEIIPLLDLIDEEAERIGAVNTIVSEGGRIKGYNTDWYGIAKTLEGNIDTKQKRALVIGAGGTGRAALHALKKSGLTISIVNRDLKKAQELAKRFRVKAFKLEMLPTLMSMNDIVINTTNVGMYPFVKESLVPADAFKPGQVVMDTVYNPLHTRLLRDAKAREATILTGDRMLLYQAIRQYQHFTGISPDQDLMEGILKKIVAHR